MIRRILLITADSAPGTLHSSGWGTHPMGLLYLAAAAREAFPGVEIRIFQTLTDPDYETTLPQLLTSFDPDLIGLRAFSLFRDGFSALSAIVRRVLPGRPIIGGGPHVSADFELLLKTGEIDLAVLGEGEETFVALLEALNGDTGRDGSLPVDLAGTAVLTGGRVQRNEKRVRIRDLDALPMPAYDLIDLTKFADINNAAHVWPRHCAYIEASRGCPYRCFYCHIAPETATHQRSPASVVAEMRRRRDELGVEAFHFIDDIFNFPRPHAKAVLREIAKELPGVRLHFPIGLRADLLDDEILDLFEAAGTVMMALAVETVTPRLQRFIGKYLKIERAHAMIDAASRRFVATTFFMAGFPTETREEAQATIDYAASLEHLCDPTLNIVRIYRGTLLWDHLAPTPDQAERLTAQTRHATTPRMFSRQPFLFYGDIFDREKVPLTSEDVAELRVDWLRKVQFNPRRILNAHARMRHFFPEAEVVRTFRSWLNDDRFDAAKMQRMMDFARTTPPTEVVPPPFARQTAPVKLSA
ncbi:radical SAM protein [Tistrella mobilis]|uniref:B12-binding domain-containing radical SAM protein n=1 Tax=Tistrella mobilis TaxID=171437 RepID=UPI003555EE17